MSEHVVSVMVTHDGWYRALCAVCDFKGPATPTRQVAGFQAEAHIAYQRQVEKLTGRDQS